MLNVQGMLRAPIAWEVSLSRKQTENDVQNARKKVAYVAANNAEEAKAIALAKPENRAFIIDGTPRRAA